MDKLTKLLVNGIKNHIEIYKRQSKKEHKPPFEREAYALSMYNSMELLEDYRKKKAEIEQKAD